MIHRLWGSGAPLRGLWIPQREWLLGRSLPPGGSFQGPGLLRRAPRRQSQPQPSWERVGVALEGELGGKRSSGGETGNVGTGKDETSAETLGRRRFGAIPVLGYSGQALERFTATPSTAATTPADAGGLSRSLRAQEY